MKKVLRGFGNLIIILILHTFLLSTAFAQDNFLKVSGEVIDNAGEPIPFANIVIKGSIVGVNTDKDGKFLLNLANRNSIIVVSSIGYQTQELEVDGRASLTIVLDEELSQLSETVVVGYGTQKKSVITGAISSVKNKDFRDQPVANVAQAMQTKVSGVQVTTPSGTPGAGLLVNIRGNFNPLYVIDGIPIISESNTALSSAYQLDGTPLGQTQNISSIADINPNDIESIEILKDASAASIYGVRAANGVVLITTKRGSSDRTEFGFNAYTGIQQAVRVPKFLSGTEMVELIEDARKQDLAKYNQDKSIFGDDFDPTVLTNPLPSHWKSTNETNWLNEIFRDAPINNIELYARGGNARTRFHISGNYFDQQGIMINSGYKRYTGRVNLDHRVNDRFTLGNTLSLTRSDNARVANDDSYTGILTNAQGADPLMPVYDKDGVYTSIDNVDGIINHTSWLSDNPMRSAREVRANTTSNRVLGSIFGEYRFSNSFKFKSTWSLDYTNLYDNQFFGRTTTDAVTTGGRGFYGSYNSLTTLGENYFTFKKQVLEDHNVELIAGMSVQKSANNRSFISGEGFPEGLSNLGNAALITSAKVTGSQWALLSYIARANYDFKNKIILSAAVRVDGSSRFNKDNRFATFPSLSVGYRLVSPYNETNPNANPFISDLKIRASHGITGDQEIGDFRNRALWSSATYLGQTGLKPLNIVDPNLGWQQNTMTNVGVDFEFLKGRYGGSVEVFQSKKNRLLSESIIQGTTGFATVARNFGTVQNTGLETQLYATPINTGAFRWTINTNVTFVRNKYTELPADGEQLYTYTDIGSFHAALLNHPISTFYGIKATGVNPDTGEMEYEDFNGDGTIDDGDAQPLGHAYPNIFGGLNMSLNYKKIDFNIASSFSFGNKVWNYNRYYYGNMGYSDEGWDENNELQQIFINTTQDWANRRWRNPGDVTDVPRASLLTQPFIENSSAMLEDASYWRIRTITLGYTLSPKSTKKWFSSARIYAQVQNPFVFTKYSWFDPEVSSTGGGQEKTAGLDLATYPQPRTTQVGVNVTF